jgi:hypothetical protein
MKTHFKKLRNPAYLGSWDLQNEQDTYSPLTLTIAGVTKETVHDGSGRPDSAEECTVVKFTTHKPMVANSTNCRAISKALGSPFIEDWKGKRITIEVKKIKAFGEFHDALRVSATAPAKEALTPAHPRFEAAKKAIAEGKTTLEAVQATFTIDAETLKLLK